MTDWENMEIIGQKVSEFYNRTPFPDYDLERFNTKYDLEDAAYPFARYLDRVIPTDKSIIDVGCGTGQLAAYLSLKRKKIWGIDFSESSLKKAIELKKKLKLDVHFQKVDIFNLEIKDKFDFVFCNGVLHHTADPYLGFKNVLKLVDKDGFIVIGLYNRYGRLILKLRKFLICTLFFNNKKVKEQFIKKQITSLRDKIRVFAWYMDQYEHPHESTHTAGEVLDWFRKNDIEYINSIPTLRKWDDFSIDFENIFVKDRSIYPNSKHIFTQLKWVWTTHNEGGYFLTVGRKNK